MKNWIARGLESDLTLCGEKQKSQKIGSSRFYGRFKVEERISQNVRIDDV